MPPIQFSPSNRKLLPIYFIFLLSLLSCSVNGISAQESLFLRGDSNTDGVFDISDPINSLGHQFIGNPSVLDCEDSSDSNDDGIIDISDPIHSLSFQFLGTAQPPEPFNTCGIDPTNDTLNCRKFDPCPDAHPTPPLPPSIDAFTSPTRELEITLKGSTSPLVIVELARRFEIVGTATSDQSGNYSLSVNLQPNAISHFFLTAIDDEGLRSAAVPLQVSQDSEAPSLFIDFPEQNALVTTATTTIAGRVSDLLSGFMDLNVTINGQAANVNSGIGTNGTFERSEIPLQLGENIFTVVATDAVGNQRSENYIVTRTALEGPRLEIVSGNNQTETMKTTLNDPLVIRLIEENGTPVPDTQVQFQVKRSDGVLLTTPEELGVRTLTLFTDENGEALTYYRLGTDAGKGNNRVKVSFGSSEVYFCASANPAPPRQINIGSNSTLIGEINGPAPEPLRVWVSDGCNGVPKVPVTFTVIKGDGSFNGESSITVDSSLTGHAETLFTIGSIPGTNLVEVNFENNGTRPAVFNIIGIQRVENAPTSFSGLVLDNGHQPIQGVQCFLTIAGQETLATTTDIQGQLNFNELPFSGPAHLFIKGQTADRIGGENGEEIPLGSFPSLPYDVRVISNANNSLPSPILLPRLDPENTKVYDGTETVELTVKGIDGLKMTIVAGTKVTLGDGTLIDGTNENSAILSLNQVHHDDVPMPMPDGAAPPFAWTLQPAGATFDPPIEITYPNMSGLSPGAIANFLSFNHDTEKFEIVSSGQVSEDGSTIKSDPGGGLTLAGWGCNCPPYSVTGAVGTACTVSEQKGADAAGVRCEDQCELLSENPKLGSYIPNVESEIIYVVKENSPKPGVVASVSFEPLNWEWVNERPEENANHFKGLPPFRVIHDQGENCFLVRFLNNNFNFKIPIIRYVDTEIDSLDQFLQNTNQFNYCDQIRRMRNYSGDGCIKPINDKSEDGRLVRALHTEESCLLHELDHANCYEKIFTEVLLEAWPRHAARLECGIYGSLEELAAAVNLAFNTIRDVYLLFKTPCFHPSHNDSQNFTRDDRAYCAGQDYLNQLMCCVAKFARDEGWTPCASLEIDCPDNVECPPPIDANVIPDGFPPNKILELNANKIKRHLGLEKGLDREVLIVEIEAVSPIVFKLNEPTTINAMAITSDGRTIDLRSLPESYLSFSSSNTDIASVNKGIITAHSYGSCSIQVSVLEHIPVTGVIEVIVPKPGDADGDFIPDALEISLGLDPQDINDRDGDLDEDGLSNFDEAIRGTDLSNPDTDGDGASDGLEFEAGTDPLSPTSLSSNWTLLVGGAMNKVNPDGTFQIFNILAPDQFGPQGPGSPPDFLSDDPIRALGTSVINGKTFYAYSEPFQISDGQIHIIDKLTVSENPPPIPEQISISAASSTLGVGQSQQLTVTGKLGSFFGGTELDLTSHDLGTTYRVSNQALASLDELGVLTAHEEGIVFITAKNEGATSVKRITIFSEVIQLTITGSLVLPDGTPAEGAVIRGPRNQSTIASADGTYTLNLILEAEELAQLRIETVHQNVTYVKTITLSQAENGSTIDLGEVALEPTEEPISIIGIAHLPDDTPAVGATVTLASRFQSLTNSEGRFSVSGTLPIDETFSVLIQLQTESGVLSKRIQNLNVIPNPPIDLGIVILELEKGGQFPGRKFALNSPPTTSAFGDVNNDGNLDIITVNIGGNISVLIGTGDGDFVSETNYDTGDQPKGLVLGDLNEDSFIDIVCANSFNHDLSVLLNNGDGTFNSELRYGVGLFPSSVAIGDLDQDGNVDLLSANSASNSISVLLGTGEGVFDISSPVNVGNAPNSVSVGDFNKDDVLDIVSANLNGGSVSILLGNGDSTFQPQTLHNVGNGPVDISMGDIDSDGNLDLVTSNRNSDDVSVLLGTGDGGFDPEVRLTVGDSPEAIILDDLNNDGDLEILTANSLSSDISVLVNLNDGNFEDEVRYTFGTGPQSIISGDVNGDGNIDVATSSLNSQEIALLLGNGDGSLESGLSYGVGLIPRHVALGDLNDDGNLDIVAANSASTNLSLLLGLGDGNFAQETRLEVGFNPFSIIIGDVNNDGNLDIITANAGGHNISVLIGTGSGNFEAEVRFPVGGSPQSIVLGDLNKDGHLDVICANRTSNDVSILIGSGDGSFSSENRFSLGLGPTSVTIGDVNNDSNLDIVSANSTSNDASILLGLGNGNFEAEIRHELGDGDPASITLGDLNGDGNLDIVSAISLSREVSVSMGNGDGSFENEARFQVGVNPNDVALGDLNGDLQLDIVTANYSTIAGDVSILLGKGNGTFEPEIRYIAGNFPQSVSLGDVNNDGKLDIVCAINDFLDFLGTKSRVSVLLSR